jgi:CSLREA domain-containing protein
VRKTPVVMMLLAVVGSLLVSHRALAVPITVNSTSDSGPGNCTATCTLRDAIATAASGDTINFSVVGLITLNGTEIVFGKDLTIIGPGARALTVSGAGASRILQITSGTVTISGLTFTNGNGPDFGGAILSLGTLNLTNCAFSGNTSATAVGAVYNRLGTLNVAGCTFSGNSAPVQGALGSSGTASIAASTFSGNSATGVAGTVGVAAGTMNLVNCTFSGNSAVLGAAYYTNPGTTNTIQNTIFNSEVGGDCFFGSGGSNTGANNMSDGSCLGTLGAVTGFDATLRNNGGPTDSFLLIPPGNAVDAAGSCSYPAGFTASIFNSALDQRGIARPLGSGCDIGALEAFAFSPASLPGGVFGIAYSQAISISAGGIGPYNFVETGALPTGITLSPAGLLSGPPAQLGSFPILVTVTDTNGFTGKQSYTLDILAPTPTPTNTPTSISTATPTSTPTNTPNPIPADIPTLNDHGLLLFGLLVAAAGLLLLIRRR